MDTGNTPAMKRDEAVLNTNNLPDKLNTVEASDKIPNDCKYTLALIQAAQNQRQASRGNLEKFLKLNIGVKVMLTVNII